MNDISGENAEVLKKDLLDRQQFVERMVYICDGLAERRKSACYAINGRWGSGKSFVLEMFENQINVIQQNSELADKYVVFHYDCWKYDYYEEPIIAIVVSMLDEIDQKENLIPKEQREMIKGLLKAVGSSLLINANEIIHNNIGVNVKEIWDIIKEGEKNKAEKLVEKQEFDNYFAFKEILKRLQYTIREISKKQTIVFVVDELDRCLPEYMIKVLERLHHIFSEVENIQVIISIDKNQIEHTVKQIYGNDTDVEKYLAKFINFELTLDIGVLSYEYAEKYSYYFDKFEYLNTATDVEDVQNFQKYILNGIDMRSRIEILDKCNLLHDLLWERGKADYSIMCIEMFLIVLKYWKVDIAEARQYFDMSNLFDYVKDKDEYTGLDYLMLIFSRDEYEGELLNVENEKNSYVRRNNIWSLIFACYRYIVGYTRDIPKPDNFKDEGIRNYCTDWWHYLDIIS